MPHRLPRPRQAGLLPGAPPARAAGPGFLGRARVEPPDIDARPEEPGARGKARQADDLPEALGGVPRPDQHGGRPGEALAGIGPEPSGVRPDRVLQSRAMDLDRVGNPAAQRAGQDHGAHHDVVRHRLVRRYRGDDIADGGDVGRDVELQLSVCQLREGAGLESFVAIGNVDRKQAPDVRQVDRAPDRLTQDRDVRRPSCQRPTASTKSNSAASFSWQSRCTSWPPLISQRVVPRYKYYFPCPAGGSHEISECATEPRPPTNARQLKRNTQATGQGISENPALIVVTIR